ncbi:tRNA (guanosine(18)-2'-O)-methyltransferase TrmH [Deinococcus cellulosilyticus]|uniref:tRNA (guanosine(18)-2'-O)-methyltransferase n=1 Tax=Deinococcus cellulosilyticus (strain DSM 18568 / NBRC 106333 / KACC 11606 / 5516J-15) TaxID=1223518 RepID=A0A511N0J5_DEIC1|nr:tRNA (guanosine(18)-2'-O)-methyltransferase TrmH [Deinococcus cellulosilyticus]GEM45957.1 tRNA (guanosine(18)-2'-O)-methyltransferase [Deinococcus cellulosilyticus NBRC 106333 = KACC 11606]
MKQARLQKIQRVLSLRQPTLTVLLEEVHKPHNLSAILRSCDAVGAMEAHAIVPRGGMPTYNATSGSAEKWVPLHTHKEVLPTIESLQQKGFQVLATHLSERAVDYRDVDYTRPTCILLGAEKWGVSEAAAKAADQNIIIPMMGMVQSLNVSVAAATILFEAQRQRQVAGMYQEPQIDPETLKRLTFEWLYPDLAEIYQDRGEAYPDIDEEGMIVQGSHQPSVVSDQP